MLSAPSRGSGCKESGTLPWRKQKRKPENKKATCPRAREPRIGHVRPGPSGRRGSRAQLLVSGTRGEHGNKAGLSTKGCSSPGSLLRRPAALRGPARHCLLCWSYFISAHLMTWLFKPNLSFYNGILRSHQKE